MSRWSDMYGNVCGSRRLLEGNIEANAPFVVELGAYCGKGSRALEVGSGTGVLGWPLAQAGVKVVSLDNDRDILAMAAKNCGLLGADIELVFGDAFKMDFPDGSFDLVWSHGLLEHFTDAEIAELLKEQRRVGKVVVAGVPLIGCKGAAFGNERWMADYEWGVRFEGYPLVKHFTYREGTMLVVTMVGSQVD